MRTARVVRTVALAAGLLIGLVLWRTLAEQPNQEGGVALAGRVRFPRPELLRGDLAGPLLFPRDAVLARADGSMVHGLVFELEPAPRAASYRCTILRRGEDPLGAGERVAEARGPKARLELDRESARALVPGRYTWEAWAEIDGLDVPLGRRDFEVRADPDTVAALEQLESLSEPARSERTLALLCERGYLGDARAWARTLPPSPERDAWLEQVPGR